MSHRVEVPPAGTTRAERARLGLATLLRLRWGAVAAQSLVIALAAFNGVSLPVVPLFILIGIAAVTNAAVVAFVPRDATYGRGLTGGLMTLDILLLTVLLGLTSGAHNPFSVLYLVYIALAALLLGPFWTWALALLSIAGYGSLFFIEMPGPSLDHAAHDGYDLHLRGMWLAFLVAAALIAHFGARLAQSIEHHQAEAVALKEQAERHRRLASLATLAAGAAHELSTPLGTIGVAAGEIERAAARTTGIGDIVEDARLIRRELDRCRGILDGMSAEAGEPAGEALADIAVHDLATDVLESISAASRARVALKETRDVGKLRLPRRAVVRAVVGLVRNALDASAAEQTVSLELGVDNGRLHITVRDQGAGMEPDVLSRVGEPFFSTKAPGRGLGLGVFLTRTLAERLGGSLDLDSEPGRGTTAAFDVPAVVSREAVA